MSTKLFSLNEMDHNYFIRNSLNYNNLKKKSVSVCGLSYIHLSRRPISLVI